jgi:hypothetical protein
MEAVKGFFRALLGDDAIAELKCAASIRQRLEVIGWLFDLQHQRVTLSAKCFEQSLHGLMSVNEFVPMRIKMVQRLASWGVRYGTICPLLHPFTSVLYNELRGRSNKYSTILLSALARAAVHMLRALTLLMGVDEHNFSRPFESWVLPKHKMGLVAELDGSLSGLGLLFFAASADGTERLVGVSEVDVRCLGFDDDSSWQNVCEYIATTAATKGASILSKRGVLVDGKPPRGVWLRGDSVTALTWADKGRVKSERAVNASLFSVMQSVKLGMPVLGWDHLPKELNTRADRISRRAETSLSLRALVDSDPGMVDAEIIDLHMEQEVLLSNPMHRLDTPGALESYWARAQEVLAGGG